MFNLYDVIFNFISELQITYSGGAVFIDIAAWIIIIGLVIATIMGYDITLIKNK